MMFVAHNAFRRELARMQAAAAHAAIRTRAPLTVHHTAEDRLLCPPMHAELGDRNRSVRLLETMADEHARLDPLMDQISAVLPQGSPARLEALFGELADALTGRPGVRRVHMGCLGLVRIRRDGLLGRQSQRQVCTRCGAIGEVSSVPKG